MRTIEDYWKDWERLGFEKKVEAGCIRYTALPELGRGGFTIMGDTRTAMGIVSDCTLERPCIIEESVDERGIEIGRYYEGSVEVYDACRKPLPDAVDYGLNVYVNEPVFHGFKRINPHVRIVNAGFSYRPQFFETLPIALPDDFWERAAAVLNPAPLYIPQISAICDQLKNCTLTGDLLTLYVQAKALEVFVYLFDYVYSHTEKRTVHVSADDKARLHELRLYLEKQYVNPPPIQVLSKQFALNREKLVTGFKETYRITINGYVQSVRMHKAVELLKTGDLSVTEIARAVGYYGDGYFQTAFKKYYGVSPGELRRELRGRSVGNDS